MAMQFGRDERTGQLGYWDGQKFVPLEKTTVKQAAQGATGMQFENISSEDRQRIEQEMQKVAPNVPQVGAPLPSARAVELEQTGIVARQASQDPRYLAETQQIGREAEPELAKFIAGTAIPAVISGGTTAAAAAAIKGGSLAARLLRMAAGGAGGYAGEKATQAVGLSEGDETTAVLSGGLGAIPGFFRPKAKALTATEHRIQRLAGGAETGAEAKTARSTADVLYGVARGGEAVNTKTLLQPLDDLIMSSRTTPNLGDTPSGEAFIRKLESLRETLVKRVLELQTKTIPGKAAVAGAEVGGLPTKPGTEVSETLTTPFNWLFEKAKGKVQGGTTATPAKTRITGIKVSEKPIEVNPENLVDDLKQLTNQKGLYREAENLGIPGLTQKLRATYKQMAGEVSGLPEADVIYSQAKGLERGTKALRTSGAVGVENLLSDPKLSGRLNAAQKEFLRKQAAQSDDIGRVTQALLKSPLGRSLIRMGVSEKGVLVPTVWNTALQIGARMAGMGQE